MNPLERIQYLKQMVDTAEYLYQSAKRNTSLLEHQGQVAHAKETLIEAQDALAAAIRASIQPVQPNHPAQLSNPTT